MREENTTHPTREQLAEFVAGKLQQDDQTRFESHVAECVQCCEILRSFPDDTLLHGMRLADTSFFPDETQAGLAAETHGRDRPSSMLPPELANHPRYRIVRQLGEGGMGVVYEAEHRMMERPVALKVITRRLVNNQEAIERFHLEVKAAARLSHRNIVTAHDAEQAGDLHYLVMEFVAGTSLSELVKQHGRLSVLHACNFAMQAAQGLQHASEHGMVHRDIKPQNLMRTPKGTIKILDFGLARMASEIDTGRLTRADSALGTADYIAPEQVEDSRHVDIRADIYSLGCTLYYLLAGHVPFPKGSVVDKILAHLNQPLPSLAAVRDDIPHEVVRIVERMMAKNPAERFQTPAEVVDALRPFSRPAPTSGEPSRGENALPQPPPEQTTVQVSDAATAGTPEQVDLFDISFADQPLTTLPTLVPPARRPRSAKQWIRVGLSVVVLASLVLAGMLLPPIVRRAFVSEAEHVEIRDGGGVWIDLMSGLDLGSSQFVGQWQMQSNELTVDAMAGARLALPYVVPEQYDFEVSFTRDSGEHSIALLFAAGNGQASYEIDAWGEHLAGIQSIRGLTLQDSSLGAGHATLRNGTSYTALVQVRRDRVSVFLDGEPIMTYEGDCSDLNVLDIWKLPSDRVLGIGAYESATTFHRIRVRPVGAS